MGMSVVEFLRRKNKIVREVTGVVLVPEDQIKEIPEDKKEPLGYYKTSEYKVLYADYCPYCVLYFTNECKGCPMYEVGNRCIDTSKKVTWLKANNIWMKKSTEKDWEKLRGLVVEYNKQFKNSEPKE